MGTSGWGSLYLAPTSVALPLFEGRGSPVAPDPPSLPNLPVPVPVPGSPGPSTPCSPTRPRCDDPRARARPPPGPVPTSTFPTPVVSPAPVALVPVVVSVRGSEVICLGICGYGGIFRFRVEGAVS